MWTQVDPSGAQQSELEFLWALALKQSNVLKVKNMFAQYLKISRQPAPHFSVFNQ